MRSPVERWEIVVESKAIHQAAVPFAPAWHWLNHPKQPPRYIQIGKNPCAYWLMLNRCRPLRRTVMRPDIETSNTISGHYYFSRFQQIVTHCVSFPLAAEEFEPARWAENEAILGYGNHYYSLARYGQSSNMTHDSL